MPDIDSRELLTSWGISFKAAANDEVVAECPVCCQEKLYVRCSGERNGRWNCFRCSVGGGLRTLADLFGKSLPDESAPMTTLPIFSVGDWAKGGAAPAPLPSLDEVRRWADALYKAESDDAQRAYDWLRDRGLTDEVIKSALLGVHTMNGQPWLTIPYIRDGHVIAVKRRSIPPAPKAFRGVGGTEAALYNAPVIRAGMDELWVAEGELDCLTLIAAGIPDAVGVPGAGVAKAQWIEAVDAATPKVIYLVYDNDKPGQAGAREMAARLGLDRCRNVLLPPFTRKDGEPGKDVTEWLGGDHTADDLRALAANAKPFDVEGVQSAPAALEDLEAEIRAQGSTTGQEMPVPWDSVRLRLGAVSPGDVIDVIAEEKIGKSVFALNWALHSVQEGKMPALIVCLEMSNTRQMRRLVCRLTQTPDIVAIDLATAQVQRDKMLAAIQETKKIISGWEADLLLGYTRASSPEAIYDLIRQAKRRYGIRLAVVDNIQLLADATLPNMAHRTIHLSKVSKALKMLALELNIVIIRIVQPHRVRDGEIVGVQDADGTSQLAKDSDATILLHRAQERDISAKEFAEGAPVESTNQFKPDMLVRVGRSRYAAGGTTVLYFDGATSTIREFAASDNRPSAPEVNNFNLLDTGSRVF